MMEFINTASTDDLRTLWREAFGDSEDYLDLFFGTVYSQKNCLAATIDGELAGALYWFDCEFNSEKTAYIYAVATTKKHRGKGVCSALMARTHLYLKENGYSLAFLVPGEASLFDFYEKMGYITCGFIDELKLLNCNGNIQTEKISACEYFTLRKDFEPENSVNLIGYYEFLNSIFEFYKGENFIFCKTKGQSFFPEFLGNNEALSPIISSMGNKSAIIRTIGNSRPFCMGISLYNSPLKADIYFPFAFD